MRQTERIAQWREAPAGSLLLVPVVVACAVVSVACTQTSLCWKPHRMAAGPSQLDPPAFSPPLLSLHSGLLASTRHVPGSSLQYAAMYHVQHNNPFRLVAFVKLPCAACRSVALTLPILIGFAPCHSRRVQSSSPLDGPHAWSAKWPVPYSRDQQNRSLEKSQPSLLHLYTPPTLVLG